VFVGILRIGRSESNSQDHIVSFSATFSMLVVCCVVIGHNIIPAIGDSEDLNTMVVL
jgi:hypothetical protein